MTTHTAPEIKEMGCHDARTEVRAVVETACRLRSDQTRRFREDALLVTSELTSNAILHGGGLTRFNARIEDGSLLVQVSDRSMTAPHLVRHNPGLPGGFGWMITQRLASHVSVDIQPDGKTITAILALP
ncbi:ATP-binding protein [Streptomyces sp. NBC_01474]|uniref:ATP-binding protein n=1 Tax=Streptomyces sp. NBC_01474 TaxID=2903880 RepID=UPI002DDA85BC|nr:ATP-binding protein [Streptomyces sp. NBC_01474]WSE00905.1 ATP-binding protein [Streptomyces sp. NBC_01474]